MPQKKGKKMKLTKIAPQVNNIKKRLMDITLKVDHYIYKNRPISSAAAMSYLQEVTTYQAICKRDARSLQVIEKLSRFMQAIIDEQSRNCDAINFDDKFNTRHSENIGASPVYSLTEEDKLEMQITVTNSRSDSFNKENTSLEVSKEKNQLRTNSPTFKNGALSTLTIVNFQNSNNQIIDTDTMDLSSYDIENKNNSDKETHVNNEIILNENDYIHLDDESPLCSQSILNTWIVPEVDNILSLPTEQCGQDMVEVDKAIKILINRTPTAPIIKENNASSKDNYKNKTKANTNKVKEISKNTKAPFNVLSNQVKTLAKKTRKRVPKNSEINKRGNSKTKHKPNIKANNKKIETLQYASAENEFSSKNTKNTKRKNFEETDLSWIENIKYVRQINNDEYDPSLTTLCESFWENCDLPLGWDDRDFNY